MIEIRLQVTISAAHIKQGTAIQITHRRECFKALGLARPTLPSQGFHHLVRIRFDSMPVIVDDGGFLDYVHSSNVMGIICLNSVEGVNYMSFFSTTEDTENTEIKDENVLGRLLEFPH